MLVRDLPTGVAQAAGASRTRPAPPGTPMIRTLIVGGDHVGGQLAVLLADVDAVQYLDDDPVDVTEAGVVGREVDITDRRQLERVGLDDAETVVVASESDSVNLLVSQLIRTSFDVDRVIVRINDPRNRDLFEATGVETVCVADALARALEAAVMRNTEDPTDLATEPTARQRRSAADRADVEVEAEEARSVEAVDDEASATTGRTSRRRRRAARTG